MNNVVNLRPDLVKAQIQLLRSQFPDLEGDDETWLLALESETELESVLAGLLSRLHWEEAMSGGVASMIAEFEAKLDQRKHRQERIKATMLSLMNLAGLQKKELPTATLSIRQGVDSVVIENPDAVPDLFCRIKREPDKTKIKQHLMEGVSLNWATLQKGQPSLSIRKQ